jgi:hypothetical protein
MISLPCSGSSEVIEDEAEIGKQVLWGKCPACKRAIFLLKSGRCEWHDHWEIGSWCDFVGSTEVCSIEPRVCHAHLSDSDIPERYLKDFNEAASICHLSPKASAALSRRILQDILKYHYQILEFNKLSEVPFRIKEYAESIRLIGNCSAHASENKITGEIVEVEPNEAIDLLVFLESLFDYAFIEPKKLERSCAKFKKS